MLKLCRSLPNLNKGSNFLHKVPIKLILQRILHLEKCLLALSRNTVTRIEVPQIGEVLELNDDSDNIAIH